MPFFSRVSIAETLDTYARNIHLSWQNNSSTTITVSWRTVDEGPSFVEYGLTTSYGQRVTGDNGIFHLVELTNLQPNTVYHYRVINGSSDAWTRDFTFKTGNVNKVARFVAWGDSRTYREDRRAVIEEVYYMQPDFSVFSGDLIENGKDRKEWKEWFADFYPLISQSPLMPCLGNHEKNNSYYYDMFALPGKEEFYSFNYGPVHFVVLHTSVPDYGGSFDEQVQWLKNDLSSVPANVWKVIVMHHPPFSSSPRCYQGYYDDVNKTFVPIFEQYGVDLVLTGHDHFYERLEKNNITYIVTGGAGAPLLSIIDKYRVSESVYIESVNHAIIIEATPEQLDFRAYRTDYSLMDGFTLNRVAGPDLRIDNVQTLKQVLISDEETVSISVSNIGTDNLNNSTIVTIIDPNGNSWVETIPSLKIGQSIKFDYSWTPKKLGYYNWTIEINSTGIDNEITKENNAMTLEYNCVEKITSLGSEPQPSILSEPNTTANKEIYWIIIGFSSVLVLTFATVIIQKKVIKL
ncbi:MAG: fibronectin type III domain-containing protein [Candidatus Heimdallarchaeaceae archaeon]